MRVLSVKQRLDLVSLLRNPWLAVAIGLLVSLVLVPLVYEANNPRLLGEGVVLETVEHGDTVVRLDSGEHVAVMDLDVPAGERTEVYVTDWDSPAGDDSREAAYVITPLMGVLSTVLTAVFASLFGGALLDRVRRLLERHLSGI